MGIVGYESNSATVAYQQLEDFDMSWVSLEEYLHVPCGYVSCMRWHTWLYDTSGFILNYKLVLASSFNMYIVFDMYVNITYI